MDFRQYVVIREEMLEYGLELAALTLDISNERFYRNGANKGNITIPKNWESRIEKFKQDRKKQQEIQEKISRGECSEGIQGKCHLKNVDTSISIRKAFILNPFKLAWRD